MLHGVKDKPALFPSLEYSPFLVQVTLMSSMFSMTWRKVFKRWTLSCKNKSNQHYTHYTKKKGQKMCTCFLKTLWPASVYGSGKNLFKTWSHKWQKTEYLTDLQWRIQYLTPRHVRHWTNLYLCQLCFSACSMFWVPLADTSHDSYSHSQRSVLLELNQTISRPSVISLSNHHINTETMQENNAKETLGGKIQVKDKKNILFVFWP